MIHMSTNYDIDFVAAFSGKAGTNIYNIIIPVPTRRASVTEDINYLVFYRALELYTINTTIDTTISTVVPA